MLAMKVVKVELNARLPFDHFTELEFMPVYKPLFEHPLAWFFREHIYLILTTPLTEDLYPNTHDRVAVITVARGLALLKLNLEYSMGKILHGLNNYVRRAQQMNLLPNTVLQHYDENRVLDYHDLRRYCRSDEVYGILEAVENAELRRNGFTMIRQNKQVKQRAQGITTPHPGKKSSTPKSDKEDSKEKPVEDKPLKEDEIQLEIERKAKLQNLKKLVTSLDLYAAGLQVLNSRFLMRHALVTSIEARRRGNRIVHQALHEMPSYSQTGAIDGLREIPEYYEDFLVSELDAIKAFQEM